MSEGSVTRPGENKWEVSYESSDSTGSSSGIMTFADEQSTESWVGQKVNKGWKISVRVLRTLLPEEYGDPDETLFLGKWDQERIVRCGRMVAPHLSPDKTCTPQQQDRRSLRRVKILCVDHRRVLRFLLGEPRLAIGSIPRDVEVLSVHEDSYRRCFTFALRHESFPVVPENTEPERIWPMWEVVLNAGE